MSDTANNSMTFRGALESSFLTDKARVFVSSTCYDLHHVRRDLEAFISSMGYVPVLSDSKDLAVLPGYGTIDTCIWLVKSSDIFVLIVGGRYGSVDPQTGKSITNIEYETAFELGIPIYTFVDSEVWTKRDTYRRLSEMVRTGSLQADKLSVALGGKIESTEVFGFIDRIETSGRDSWIREFTTAADIINALTRNWSLLFKNLLFHRRSQDASRNRVEALPLLMVNWLDSTNERLDVLSVEGVPALDRDSIIAQLLSLKPAGEDVEILERWSIAAEGQPEFSDLQRLEVREQVATVRRFVRVIDEMVSIATARFDEFCWRYDLRSRSAIIRLQISNNGTVPAGGVVILLEPADEVYFHDMRELDNISLLSLESISQRISRLIAAAKQRLVPEAMVRYSSMPASHLLGTFNLQRMAQSRFSFRVEAGRLRIDIANGVKHNLSENIDLKSMYVCPRLTAGRKIEITYQCHADNLPKPTKGGLLIVAK